MSEVKICNKCNRELSKDTDHFYKKRGTPDGFTNMCKECNGQKFTKYLQLKDGEMICKRCEKTLPYTNEYFPVDKNTKTGLRNVCYICSKGKSGSARYGKRKEKALKWTKEEDKLLVRLYPDHLNEEIAHHFPARTDKALMDRAATLGIRKSEIAIQKRYEEHSERMKAESHWIGVPKTKKEKEFLSNMMKQLWETDYDRMLKGVQYERTHEHREHLRKLRSEEGNWKGDKNPRHIYPLKGAENGRWEGGILQFYFGLEIS